MSQTEQQKITMHILLPNISRSKGNQKMEFAQLIFNRNIFPEKSYTKGSTI